MLVGLSFPVCIHPTSVHLHRPRAIRVLRPMVLDTHQCHFRAALGPDKHWHHDELPFHAEPWWKIVHTKSHRPSAMTTTHLTKRIHAIRTQTEPYVSRIQIKFRVRSIYFSPLRPIS